MKKRTSVLLAAALLIGILAGCGGGNTTTQEVVNVYNWGEYMDEDLLAQFESETGIKVNLLTYETNEQMYSVLKQGGVNYDVIVPSDYMIARMIEEDMLEKIDFANVPNFEHIDDEFMGMVFDPTNEYSVAYTWGTTGLIYNSAMIDEEPTSWGALFDEKYSDQILMFDNSRDAMGIALKYLGYSFNTANKAELDEAFALLQEQKPLIQAYVMDQIFDKLEGGEAAIGPYYAGDYLTMIENNPDLIFIVPDEGSNVFVDSMCIPKGAANKKNAEIFINFMCEAEVSYTNCVFIGYTSPITEVRAMFEEELDEYEFNIMYPSDDILAKCEPFTHLPAETLEQYNEYWVLLKS